MKSWKISVSFFAGILLALSIVAFTDKHKTGEGYIIEHEMEIAKQEQGPHKGGGVTTAYPFFFESCGPSTGLSKKNALSRIINRLSFTAER